MCADVIKVYERVVSFNGSSVQVDIRRYNEEESAV
jgi:hypothetical protein